MCKEALLSHLKDETTRLTTSGKRKSLKLCTEKMSRSQSSRQEEVISTTTNAITVQKRKASLLGIKGRSWWKADLLANEYPATFEMHQSNSTEVITEQKCETNISGDSVSESFAINSRMTEPVPGQNLNLFLWKGRKRTTREMRRWRQKSNGTTDLKSGSKSENVSPNADRSKSPRILSRVLFQMGSKNVPFSGNTSQSRQVSAPADENNTDRQSDRTSAQNKQGKPSKCCSLDCSYLLQAPHSTKIALPGDNRSGPTQTAKMSIDRYSDSKKEKVKPATSSGEVSQTWTPLSSEVQDSSMIGNETDHLKMWDGPSRSRHASTRSCGARSSSTCVDPGTSVEYGSIRGMMQSWRRNPRQVSADCGSPWGIPIGRALSDIEHAKNTKRLIGSVLNVRKNSLAPINADDEANIYLSGSVHYQSAGDDHDISSPSPPLEMMQDDFVDFYTDSTFKNRKRRMFGLRAR